MYKNTTPDFNPVYSQIKVNDLINTKVFKYSDIIASNKALYKKISSVTIMDIENILEWINEGEALIIGQFMQSHFSTSFINSLINKKVSCIITKKKI